MKHPVTKRFLLFWSIGLLAVTLPIWGSLGPLPASLASLCYVLSIVCFAGHLIAVVLRGHEPWRQSLPAVRISGNASTPAVRVLVRNVSPGPNS